MKQVKFEEVAVSDLSKAVWNYRDNDEAAAKVLTASLRENGLVENLVVYEKNGGKIVLNGNHRLDSLHELGVEKAQVCNVGKILDGRAKKMAIQLNESRFPNDLLKLSSILQELAEDPTEKDLLKDLPFSKKELNGMLKEGAGGTGSGEGRQKTPDDLLIVKMALSEDQVEAWLVWKREVGTENDAAALMKALEYAIPARKQENLGK